MEGKMPKGITTTPFHLFMRNHCLMAGFHCSHSLGFQCSSRSCNCWSRYNAWPGTTMIGITRTYITHLLLFNTIGRDFSQCGQCPCVELPVTPPALSFRAKLNDNTIFKIETNDNGTSRQTRKAFCIHFMATCQTFSQATLLCKTYGHLLVLFTSTSLCNKLEGKLMLHLWQEKCSIAGCCNQLNIPKWTFNQDSSKRLF